MQLTMDSYIILFPQQSFECKKIVNERSKCVYDLQKFKNVDYVHILNVRYQKISKMKQL